MALNFHQKAMLIGAVTVALCVGVFVWIVVLDKGTLEVSANPPYSISVEGNRLKIPEEQLCTSDPCELSLPSGDFTLTVSKSGYFEETAEVSIDRGETTALEFSLTYVPIVGEVVLTEGATPVAVPDAPASSPDFTFVDDTTYNKQRLDYTDPLSGGVITWAYFDRALVNPLVFPNADHTKALVVDQAKAVDQLYLVDGINFTRAWAGGVEDFVSAQWAPNERELFFEAAGSTTLFYLDPDDLEIESWPLANSLEKVTWDNEGHRLFATQYDLNSDADEEGVTSLQVIQMVLEGVPDQEEARAFSIGEYNPATDTYRALYDVPVSAGISYETVYMVYDEETKDLYFTDRVRFFKVVRGE